MMCYMEDKMQDHIEGGIRAKEAHDAEELDAQIRTALQHAADNGKMNIVAMVCGVPEENCWEILNSTGEISMFDRILLRTALE